MGEQYQDVETSRRLLEIKYRAHLLHQKYVLAERARHEINIGWQLRKSLASSFKDLGLLMANPQFNTLESFKEIWSECIEEQFKYCGICITRFKQTPDFQRIMEHYADTVIVEEK